MAEKSYKVKKGKRITGRHAVYTEGQTFPETEAFGDMERAVKEGIVELIEKKDPPAPTRAQRPTK